MNTNMNELLRDFDITLREYLKRNGMKILSLAYAAGQREVRLSALGLYRYYRQGLKPRFSEILDSIYKDERLRNKLAKRGIRIVKTNDKYLYEIILDIEVIRKYIGSRDDDTGMNDIQY